MSGRRRAAVKVRWMRGAVTGPWTTEEAALKLQEDLEHEVVDCGDGCGFVAVEGFDSREVLIRGREVVTIECVREMPASVRPSSTITSGVGLGESGGVITHGGVVVQTYGHQPAAPGTEFLRQQAAARLAAESGQRVQR